MLSRHMLSRYMLSRCGRDVPGAHDTGERRSRRENDEDDRRRAHAQGEPPHALRLQIMPASICRILPALLTLRADRVP
jgi:hypothetical protein